MNVNVLSPRSCCCSLLVALLLPVMLPTAVAFGPYDKVSDKPVQIDKVFGYGIDRVEVLDAGGGSFVVVSNQLVTHINENDDVTSKFSLPEIETAADMAALLNGRLVVAWENDDEVAYRVYRISDGTVLTKGVVDAEGRTCQSGVGALGDGGFLLSYCTGGSLFVERFSDSGESVWSHSPGGNVTSTVVVPCFGGHVVAWLAKSTELSASERKLFGKRFELSGAVGDTFELETDYSYRKISSLMGIEDFSDRDNTAFFAGFSSGGFFVVIKSSTGSYLSVYQHKNTSKPAIASERFFVINARAMASFASGGLVAANVDHLTLYENDSVEQILPSPSPMGKYNTAGLANGDFIVAWRTDGKAYAQRYVVDRCRNTVCPKLAPTVCSAGGPGRCDQRTGQCKPSNLDGTPCGRSGRCVDGACVDAGEGSQADKNEDLWKIGAVLIGGILVGGLCVYLILKRKGSPAVTAPAQGNEAEGLKGPLLELQETE